MKRVMVVVVATALLLVSLAGSALSWNGCMPPPPQCGPQQTFVTKMVPCVRTEMVPEVQPCTRTVTVQKVGYKTQNFLVKGTPVGMACSQDPCTKCFPQPFCQVVQQKVPFVYCEPVQVPWYNVVYKPVCRKVMMPQTYLVETVPVCGK
jgi:hypothetical protein